MIDYQKLIKIFGEIIVFWGEFKGGEAPQGIKMGIFKPKAYF